MKFFFLFVLVFSTLFFVNFTTLNNKIYRTKTEQNESLFFNTDDCIPRYIAVSYASYLSFAERNAIRNYYISKYKIQLVPSTGAAEIWYVCIAYDGSRPGNGGINREIDEDPDLNPGYSNPNAM